MLNVVMKNENISFGNISVSSLRSGSQERDRNISKNLCFHFPSKYSTL